MEILNTIVPIFTIIFLGWVARRLGFIKPDFLGPANRLVYYLAIPALIFRAISKTALKTQFNPQVLALTLAALVITYLVAWAAGYSARLRKGRLATFVQSSFHGNLGYIGLAVIYYLSGTEGVARGGIIAGFMMILQNLLSVVVLQVSSGSTSGTALSTLRKIVGNPVIVAAMAGILFSLAGLRLPVILARGLDIMSGMGLPMALLIIGASLSFGMVRESLPAVLTASTLKLLLLPAVGFALYTACGIATRDYLPGLILLASPTATISYVMAKEMGGDADLAVVAISTCTLISALTFYVWILFAA